MDLPKLATLSSQPLASRCRPTVLVVDDNPANRELVRGYLEAHYEIVEAESGPAALALLAGTTPDLILLDVMMPGMSGLEVCRRIKNDADGRFLPILLLTAMNDQEDRNAGLAAGADDFLTKPVDGRELALRVRAFLRIREQEQVISRQLEELQHLSALKDDLVSLIVHDLRNPLTSMLGMLELLQLRLEEPKVRADIGSVLRSASRVREAVEDLLNVRLFEEGRLEPQVEPVTVADVVREAIDVVEGAGERSGVTIRVAVAGEGNLTLDRKLVRRAIENLLVNALKYSPTGGTVDVTVRSAAQGAEIGIADRGPGIPDTFKSSLFEKFGSVEAQKGESRRGFGLGLYMVRLVAQVHGGEVSARDRDGGGTVFTMLFPVAHTVDRLAATTASAVSSTRGG